MAKRIGTVRRKTRHKLGKSYRQKGKISITSYLQNFKHGDRIQLAAESALQKGMYHARFYGKVGTVKGRKGKCYEISISDKGKEKTLIVHPIHLKRL
jgi:large subunit ribosomal protein L21e